MGVRAGSFVLGSAAAALAAVVLAGSAPPGRSRAAQELVDQSAAVVSQIESDGSYAKKLRTAKGVILIPRAGASGIAHAVLIRHERDGSWTPPAFMTVGAIVSAARGSARAGCAAILLMTDRALADFSRDRFAVTSGRLTVVTHVARGQPLGGGDAELWSGPAGAFDGVALAGGVFVQDDTLDRAYYGARANVAAILAGRAKNAGEDRLRAALPL